MQTDRRFIQNVEHPDQRGTDLGCQTDALTFPPRKSARSTVKGQVIEPDINQKREPLPDLLQDPASDFRLFSWQLDFGEKHFRIAYAQCRYLLNILPGNTHTEGFRFEPGTITARTRHDVHKLLKLLAGRIGIGFTQASFQVRNHALERFVIEVSAIALIVEKLDLFLP